MTLPTQRPLVVSQGDPQGVGPELVLRLAAEGRIGAGDVLIADPDRFRALATTLAVPWAEPGWAALQPLVQGHRGLGQFEALRLAVDTVLDRPGTALVTAPIDKARAKAEGLSFAGHTEYLAARCGDAPVAMLMAGPTMRVVPATIHLALRDVADALTIEAVHRAGTLLVAGLRSLYGIERPTIAVLGLNPHAGERGLLGDEESTVIEPAIERLRTEQKAARFEGPLPADSAFFAHRRGDYDAVIAMYHDQGLGPFKLVHFHDGVNVTLGLPFVRTSPDHGTARDIAGTGTADPTSMRAAVALARGEAS